MHIQKSHFYFAFHGFYSSKTHSADVTPASCPKTLRYQNTILHLHKQSGQEHHICKKELAQTIFFTCPTFCFLVSLWGEWDSSRVSHLPLLQVLHQLSEPSLCGGIIFQNLSEGGVFELVGQTLAQGFTGSEII